MSLVALVTTTLMTKIHHDHNHKGHSLRSSETHGILTKCHVSLVNIYTYISNQILPYANLLT